MLEVESEGAQAKIVEVLQGLKGTGQVLDHSGEWGLTFPFIVNSLHIAWDETVLPSAKVRIGFISSALASALTISFL
jgi:hypothetical protein